MKFNTSSSALSLAAAAFGTLIISTSVAHAASDIDTRLRMLEAEIAKLRKEAATAKAQAAAAHQAVNKATGGYGSPITWTGNKTNVGNAGQPKDPNAPPAVFVTMGLGKGIIVENEDKSNVFKLGGRLLMDYGGTAGSPGNGWQGNVGVGQARIEIEGKTNPWFYKLQYDFANTTTQLYNTNLPNANGGAGLAAFANNYVTDRNFLWGGFRDAYVGLQDPRLSAPWLEEPVYFKIGSQFEPFSLEAVASSKFRDTIERPMAVDVIAPARHIGASFGMFAKNNVSFAAGIYSLSFQDLNVRPVNTSSGNYGVIVPTYNGVGVTNKNWYQPWGGGAYWETSGRLTWAPIREEHRLLHVGVSGSYHQGNNSTAYSDDRNNAPGNRLGSEANVLGSTYLGTTDLSCGRWAQNGFLVNPANGSWNTYNAAGNCVNSIQKLDVEMAASYENFFVQGEYLMANYNRNSFNAEKAGMGQLAAQGYTNLAPNQGLFLSPANSRYMTSGGYVQGEWWITGEEKSQSYSFNDKNAAGPGFVQLKIKHPFSKGGWGAWGLVGRWSVLNLNNGPFSGGNINNALAYSNNANGWFNGAIASPTSAAGANSILLTNAIANSGIYGGYQQNVTGGINWYPDNGVAFQFNATHVMSLKSPLNWNPQAGYEGGSHPTFLEVRTKVYF